MSSSTRDDDMPIATKRRMKAADVVLARLDHDEDSDFGLLDDDNMTISTNTAGLQREVLQRTENPTATAPTSTMNWKPTTTTTSLLVQSPRDDAVKRAVAQQHAASPRISEKVRQLQVMLPNANLRSPGGSSRRSPVHNNNMANDDNDDNNSRGCLVDLFPEGRDDTEQAQQTCGEERHVDDDVDGLLGPSSSPYRNRTVATAKNEALGEGDLLDMETSTITTTDHMQQQQSVFVQQQQNKSAVGPSKMRRSGHPHTTTADPKELRSSEREGSIMDLEDETTVDGAEAESRQSATREKEADLLDFDDMSSVPESSIVSKRDTGAEEGEADMLDMDEMSSVPEASVVAPPEPESSPTGKTPSEQEADLLDFDDLSSVPETTTKLSPIVARRHIEPKDQEAGILDLDDISSVPDASIGAPELSTDDLEQKIMERRRRLDDASGKRNAALAEQNDRIAAKLMGGKTTGTSSKRNIREQEKLQIDPSDENEKVAERRRKLEIGSTERNTALAEQNDRIAAKIMGNTTTTSSNDETREQVKVREYRDAHEREISSRREILAGQNNLIASKITGNGQLSNIAEVDKLQEYRESQTNASAERQAQLAADNHAMGVKLAQLEELTDLVRQDQDKDTEDDPIAGEVHDDDSPVFLTEKEESIYDLELGEDDTKLARAEEVDMYIPSAVEFDSRAKPPVIRNRRFQLYAFLTVFSSLAIALSVAITVSGTVPTGISYRETLGIGENVALILGEGASDDLTGAFAKALNWTTHEDKLRLTPDHPNFVQRFLAACFYFETSTEEDWHFECKPSNVPSEDEDQPNRCEYVNNGGHPIVANRWLSGDSECSWGGIECDELGQIRSLDACKFPTYTMECKLTPSLLARWNISSEMPDNINQYFPQLQKLSLRENRFRGELSRHMFTETRHLVEFNMQRNGLEGRIPDSLYRSPVLKRVDLSRNALGGTLSTEIGTMQALKAFLLVRNIFSGTIPSQVMSSPSLSTFEVRGNVLSGTIPNVTGAFNFLDLGENMLTGTISSEFGKTTTLFELYLDYNRLTGTIPETFFENPFLSVVKMDNNRLGGQLSPSLSQLSALLYLNVQNNTFAGSVPVEWVSLPFPYFGVIRLDGNNLEGSMPLCPESRKQANRTELTLLTASGNKNLTCECCDDGSEFYDFVADAVRNK